MSRGFTVHFCNWLLFFSWPSWFITCACGSSHFRTPAIAARSTSHLRKLATPARGSSHSHARAFAVSSTAHRRSTVEIIQPSSTSHICANPKLAQRTGRDHCWASFQMDLSQQLCVSKQEWEAWLKYSYPPEICSVGASKLTAWPLNSIESNDSGIGKKRSRLFLAKMALRAPPRVVQKVYFRFLQWVERWRESTALLLKPSDPYGIFRKLLVNEAIPNSPLPLFRKLGFVHLVTATGIHLYAVSRVSYQAVEAIVVYLKFPIPIGLFVARVISGTFCLCIWLLSGARLGMLRPWGILLIRELGVIGGFRWKRAAPLSIALSLDLLWGFYQAGFTQFPTDYSGRLVYTLAVGGGMLWRQSLSSLHLSLAVGSWVLVALWEAWESGTLSLATPLLSLITLPMICFIVYPLAFLSILIITWNIAPLATPFAQLSLQILTENLSRAMIKLAEWSLYPGNLWIVPRWTIVVSGALALIYVFLVPWHSGRAEFSRGIKFSKHMKFSWPREFIWAMLLLAVSLSTRFTISSLSNQPSAGNAQEIEQLDVGQGDAALVIDADNITYGMIDAGAEKRLSETTWLEILARRKINKLQWLALTHLDEDHAGGVLRLAKLVRISCVSLSRDELRSERGERFKFKLERMGVKITDWSRPCVPYPTLAPVMSLAAKHNQRNMNMGAIWIPLVNGGFYLSAGDASAQDEDRIGNWAALNSKRLDPSRQKPAILKINHHGSRFSTTPRFLKLIQPTVAWISAGFNNVYGHPHPTVLERLAQLKIRVRRTDLEGSLHLD